MTEEDEITIRDGLRAMIVAIMVEEERRNTRSDLTEIAIDMVNDMTGEKESWRVTVERVQPDDSTHDNTH